MSHATSPKPLWWGRELDNLDRLRYSKVYICRLPPDLAPGRYWIQMRSNEKNFTPSERHVITVKSIEAPDDFGGDAELPWPPLCEAGYEDRLEAMDMKQHGDLWAILGSVYGLVNGLKLWHAEVTKRILELGWIAHSLDPALLLQVGKVPHPR